MKLEFSRQIIKKPAVPNFNKIRPVLHKLFHADGRTDMKQQMDVVHNLPTATILVNSVTFGANDSGGIVNRNILLHTETDMIFETVRTHRKV